MRIQLLFAVLVLIACGCGASTQPVSPDEGEGTPIEGETLDCSWLVRNDCWEEALRELAECVPAHPAVGHLSSEGACDFVSGEIITSRTTSAGATAVFVGGRGQRACGMVSVSVDEWSIGTKLGTTTVVTRNGGVRVTCHDGREAVTADSASALTECASALPRIQIAMSEKLTIGTDRGDSTRWLCE